MSETAHPTDPVAERVVDGAGEAFEDRAGAALLPLVTALVTGLQQIADLTDPGAHPWSDAFDLDASPAPQWLGAITGTPVPLGIAGDEARAFVRNRPTWRRGTPAALLAAARSAYTRGHIELLERDGSPWRATLLVFGATDVELARILAAASTQKPVGIVLTAVAATGAAYQHFTTVHGSYAALGAELPTYDAMTAHQAE